MHNYRTSLAIFVVLLLGASQSQGRTPHNFVPVSLSYSFPGGGLSDSVGAKSALGFSLGYRFESSKHVRIGARGTWTRLNLGVVDTADFSNYGLTHVGIMASVQYRFIKHGWSPYVEIEGGMGMLFADELIANQPRRIDGLSDVKLSAGGVFGVLIPLGPVVDVDISGRYQSTFVENGFTTLAAHVGIVYAFK